MPTNCDGLLEKDFMAQILQLAGLFRWKRAHFRPAMTKHGWRTPVQADGKGFPDLILVKDRLIVVELKTDDGKLRPEQADWLDAFAGAGVECYTWRPKDWPEVEAVLTGKRLPRPSPSGPEAAESTEGRS